MSPGPAVSVTSVTIGAPDPHRLAAFYAALLGWSTTGAEGPDAGEPPGAGWAQLRPPPGEVGLTMNFEFERNWRAPTWPSVRGAPFSTIHLDLLVEDLDASVALARDLGAVLAPVQPQGTVRVMFDPAGHPFCFFTDH